MCERSVTDCSCLCLTGMVLLLLGLFSGVEKPPLLLRRRACVYALLPWLKNDNDRPEHEGHEGRKSDASDLRVSWPSRWVPACSRHRKNGGSGGSR